jgi:hypothetical protein
MNKTRFLPMSKCVFPALLLSVVLAPFGQAQATGRAPIRLSRYGWHQVTENAEWQGRAGLQAVELRNDLYIMGGRGAFNPFGTVIYPDVWRSVDRGATWTQTTTAAWPARAYFQAVTHQGQMFAFGGQNFDTLPNPAFPGCPDNPPGVPCFPFIPDSTFYNDVWKSRDGANWSLVTPAAGWAGRAGLSAVVFRGHIYVLGGSQGDDASTGGQGRILFNDVWKSKDGETWMQVTDNAPWPPRAGAAVVVKNGFIYLLGGERGFTCGGAPGCNAERDLYFHDVWRSRNGEDWELVTPAAGWSARPGHQCVLLINQIVCFGGYGEPQNPDDIWVSADGKEWNELPAPASPPWDAATPDDVKYDFDALVVHGCRSGLAPSIMTFGGDRERFELPPGENATRVDNDVWRMSPPRW